MSMNILPDDCLLHIFNFIHDVNTLFKYLRVNKRWNRLVSYRLSRAGRLLDTEMIQYTELCSKTLWYDEKVKPLERRTLSRILKKSPNLKIVSVGLDHERYEAPDMLQKCINRLRSVESLEGLILNTQSNYAEVNSIPQSVKSLHSYDAVIKHGYYPSVKQLMVDDVVFIACIHRFPNVEWLHLRIGPYYCEWFTEANRNQDIFKNLKVLEFDSTFVHERPVAVNLACQFIEFCPQLESAHLRIPIDHWVYDDKFKHQNLTNLVLTFEDLGKIKTSLYNLQIILKTLPNIKHLVIDYMFKLDDTNRDVSDDSVAVLNNILDNEPESNAFERDGSDDMDDNVKEERSEPMLNQICRLLPMFIVHELKNLELLYMRGIVGIDESTERFVQLMCKLHDRSIKFYYKGTKNNIIRDFPELFDKNRDCSAFKFMSKHFLETTVDSFESINSMSDV